MFQLASLEFEPTTCRDPKHCVHESYALPTELIGRCLTKHKTKGPYNIALQKLPVSFNDNFPPYVLISTH